MYKDNKTQYLSLRLYDSDFNALSALLLLFDSLKIVIFKS